MLDKFSGRETEVSVSSMGNCLTRSPMNLQSRLVHAPMVTDRHEFRLECGDTIDAGACIKYQSGMWTSCNSGLLSLNWAECQHIVVNNATARWRKRRDRRVYRDGHLSSSCDFAC